MTSPTSRSNNLAQRIDALLPQTQCTRCGYPACLAYADAISRDEADINQCPPGGAEGIRLLAALLDRPEKPLNPINGFEAPAKIARIDEDACIGCTKCIQVCPVDAIVGAAKMMHTVIVDECSGCDLCIPACPVDCITMIDPAIAATPADARAAQYRRRYESREARLARDRAEHAAALAARKTDVRTNIGAGIAVLEALARAKARKANSMSGVGGADDRLNRSDAHAALAPNSASTTAGGSSDEAVAGGRNAADPDTEQESDQT